MNGSLEGKGEYGNGVGFDFLSSNTLRQIISKFFY